MKVSRIQVDRYRNIQNLDFTVPTDSSLLCLTGKNGCGKSNLLRLISMAVGQLRLGGGSPVWDHTDHNVAFTVSFDFSDEPEALWTSDPPGWWPYGWKVEDLVRDWTKTIAVTLWSETQFNGNGENHAIAAPGLDSQTCSQYLLPWLEERFDSQEELKHLHLQSDRAFSAQDASRLRMESHELSEAKSFLGRKVSSFKTTQGLYGEWTAVTVANELARLSESRAAARQSGSDGVAGYEDPFAILNSMVQTVLPHILVKGVDSDFQGLVIRSGNVDIDFQRLSGGEREVLFLCGQIHRLRLTRGILLIDEPELHLNPDLLRDFLTMVRQTAGEGQLWLATHSYEAIEAAGQSSTFVMESSRDQDTTLTSLRDQPVVKTLSSVLGRVGFGLSNTSFVIVEGSKDSIRERQRYAELVGRHEELRFVDIGEAKRDVKRMLDGLLKIADASGEQLNVRAVVDADFDSLETVSAGSPRLHQLKVHEVENLFLEPLSLKAAVSNIAPRDELWDFEAIIRERFAAKAGKWIWHRVQYRLNVEWRRQQGKLEAASRCSKVLLQRSWDQIEQDKINLLGDIKEIDEQMAQEVQSEMATFSRLLSSSDLWKHCFGKETLKYIATKVRYSDHEVLERAVISAWNDGRAARPHELVELRTFLGVED